MRYGSLKQEEGGVDAQDAMDDCLCRVEPEKQMVTFAGAKRPLFLVKNGRAESDHSRLVEIKGDRKSIGQTKEECRVFTSREISVSHGDVLYLTSDGYIDQGTCTHRFPTYWSE